MDENKSFNFYVGDAGNRVGKTLRMSQVMVERLAMVLKVSTILFIRYFWFKKPFCKHQIISPAASCQKRSFVPGLTTMNVKLCMRC